MHRNIEGLRRSARSRSEDALQRALVALGRLESSGREINFRTVAAEGQVSSGCTVNAGCAPKSRICANLRPGSLLIRTTWTQKIFPENALLQHCDYGLRNWRKRIAS